LGLAGGVAPRWRAAAVECQVACMAPAQATALPKRAHMP
jgi:hypothetical protein